MRRGAVLGVAREFERLHQVGGPLRLLASSALRQRCLRGHSHCPQRGDRLQQLTAIIEQCFNVGDIRLYKSALTLRRRRGLDVTCARPVVAGWGFREAPGVRRPIGVAGGYASRALSGAHARVGRSGNALWPASPGTRDTARSSLAGMS